LDVDLPSLCQAFFGQYRGGDRCRGKADACDVILSAAAAAAAEVLYTASGGAFTPPLLSALSIRPLLSCHG